MRPLFYLSSIVKSTQMIAGAYRRIMQLPSVRRDRVAVHTHNFVDPRTGVHTQEVESCWSQLKLGQKQRKGSRREDLQSYLDERMWRQQRGGDHTQIMANFIVIISYNSRLTTLLCDFGLACDITFLNELKLIFLKSNCSEMKRSSEKNKLIQMADTLRNSIVNQTITIPVRFLLNTKTMKWDSSL